MHSPIQSRAAIEDIVARVRGVAGPGDFIPLHEPEFAGNEWAYVKDCIDTGWVSSVGAYVDRFEAMLAEITGSPHAIATMNGTAALHIALVLAGVERGDEVLIPSLTFIATANAVSAMSAAPPVPSLTRGVGSAEQGTVRSDGRYAADGRAIALYHPAYIARIGAPEAMAREYLAQRGAQLGLLATDPASLVRTHLRNGRHFSVVRFAQYADGLPIYGSDVAVSVQPNGKVIYVYVAGGLTLWALWGVLGYGLLRA